MLRTLAGHVAGRLRMVAMLFALAVAGGTGTAAALTSASTGPSHPSAVHAVETESPEPQESESPEPAESESPDPAESESPDPAESETPKPTVSATPCPGGLSHGEFVSKVAQDTETGKDSEHGKTVSAAAKMDCGKGADDANDNEGADDQGAHAEKSGSPHADNSGTGKAGDEADDQGEASDHSGSGSSGSDDGDHSGHGHDGGGDS